MNQSHKIMKLFEQKKENEFRKGDEVKINMSALKNLPEPQLNLIKQILKKSENKPVVIRVADDSIDVAESPMAGITIGTVQVPKSAVSKVGGKDDHEDTRMDVDAEDAIKPLKKEKGENLAQKLSNYLKEDTSKKEEPKKRCKFCGAFLVKGRCPVDKKDCGR